MWVKGDVVPMKVGKGDSNIICMDLGKFTMTGCGYLNGLIACIKSSVSWERSVTSFE